MRREIFPVFTLLCLGLIWFAGCSSYQQGLMQSQRSQYPAAIEHFEKALQSDPGHLEARRQLGYAYLKNGQHAEAIEQFRLESFWGIWMPEPQAYPQATATLPKAGSYN
jgi:tetratricopeptide (TPR) repeat protein